MRHEQHTHIDALATLALVVATHTDCTAAAVDEVVAWLRAALPTAKPTDTFVDLFCEACVVGNNVNAVLHALKYEAFAARHRDLVAMLPRMLATGAPSRPTLVAVVNATVAAPTAVLLIALKLVAAAHEACRAAMAASAAVLDCVVRTVVPGSAARRSTTAACALMTTLARHDARTRRALVMRRALPALSAVLREDVTLTVMCGAALAVAALISDDDDAVADAVALGLRQPLSAVVIAYASSPDTCDGSMLLGVQAALLALRAMGSREWMLSQLEVAQAVDACAKMTPPGPVTSLARGLL
jgi:hypothetical protein